MRYILKKEVAEKLKKTYKNMYIAERLGLSEPYVSSIMNRRKALQKHVAYCFVKTFDNEAEIKDMFDLVK